MTQLPAPPAPRRCTNVPGRYSFEPTGPAAPRRCGTIHLGRPRPETTEKCSPDALGRPRHESAVANLPRSPSRFASRSSIASTATASASSGVGELTLAKRTGSAFASSRHAASWRSISATSSSGLRAWISSAGASSRSVRSGRGRTFATQADEPRTGTQPVAPGIDGEVVPPSLEDDEGGACSRPADRRKPADQRVRCEIADPGDRSGGCRRRSSMRCEVSPVPSTAEEATRRRKHAGGEMEPSCAPEQAVRCRLQTVRQRRLPCPVGPDDGDEQPGGAAESSYHPGGTEPRPQRQSPRCSAASFDQAPDLAQRRHRVGSISERSCQCVPQPSNAACSKVDAPAGSALNFCWS